MGYPNTGDIMKRNLFVTLADENYVEPAKQLFSSVYWNAGWTGDYMLLSHGIKEENLDWFRRKGIAIKKCEPLFKGKPGGMSAVLTSKLYLFGPEFKKWKTVVYCDADAIVKGSLDEFNTIGGFCSVMDIAPRLRGHLIVEESIINRGLDMEECDGLVKEIGRKYNLRKPAFCAGFFAFNTDIITKDTLDGMVKMMRRYHQVSEYGDQLPFNLFFYEKWKQLPPVYNIQLLNEENRWLLRPEHTKGIILHFVSKDKPWIARNYFYKEWKSNLNKADSIDLNSVPIGKSWGKKQIRRYCGYLKMKESFPLLDRSIGKVGVVLSIFYPNMHRALKRIKTGLMHDIILGGDFK